MKITKIFPAGGHLAFQLEVVESNAPRTSRKLGRHFGARTYIFVKMKGASVNPLFGARYEMFWYGIVDRALEIAFPGQISRIDDAIWMVGRSQNGSAKKLVTGLETFERLFRIAITGVDPNENVVLIANNEGRLVADPALLVEKIVRDAS